MKIIITEKIADESVQYLKDRGFTVDVRLGLSVPELNGIIGGYDAIIVRSATKVTEDLLEYGARLKVVGRAGNGIDNINVPACTKRGIMVVNTPESNIMAAAELAVALAFAIFRNIPQAHLAAKGNDFRRSRFTGIELDGKTVGIIGFGRIGGIVASKFKGCNMRVIAFDPFIADEKYTQMGVEKCETVEELLQQSDLITLHTPKIAGGGIIGAEQLAMCKKGVMIVNCARGGLINEKALYDALVSGQVAAVGLDVLETEPDFTKKPEEQTYQNPLLTLPNVIYTPHLGASTNEANENVGKAITKIVGDALDGQMVAAVNMPPMKANITELKPFINLAEHIGKIYYQVEKTTVQKIEVVFSGDLADKETRVMSLSALKGFLEPIVNETVNFVNAELIAKGMGIELHESKSSALDKYTNLITVKFTTNKGTSAISGTVFAREDIRIVDFFGYMLDFEPMQYVIAVQNIDKPGIIGKIGTVLGNHSINIAAMQWSRNKKAGDKAVAFVSVDCIVSDDILDELKKIDGVLKASVIVF